MLTFRKPAILFTPLAWIFSGPLNFIMVAILVATALEDSGSILDTWLMGMYLVGLPATIGISLVLWRLRRKPITIGRIFTVTFFTAIATAALFPLLFFGGAYLVITLSSLGTGELNATPADLQETLGALVMLPLFGVTYGLILALPAALFGALGLRLFAFTSRQDQPTE